MSVKSVPQKSEGNGNILYIHARIQTGETKARIEDLDGKVESFKVSIEDLPDYPKLPTKFVLDECSVVWDADSEKVISINPYNGVFLAVGLFLGPRPDGGDGEPKANLVEKEGINGKKPYTVKNFHEIFKIVDKESIFYGTTPRLFLQDKFVDDGNGMAGYSGTDKSKWTVRLSKFGNAQGLFDEDITWPKDGNVLPELEKRIQNNEREVQLVFEGGFINTLLPVMKQPKRSVDEINKELGYTDEVKTVDDLDSDFPKKAVKTPERVAQDDEVE
jgi:hypothetical protein